MKDKYKGYEIIVEDTSLERLDRALARHGIVREMANGVDIQIDVLRIAKKKGDIKIIFIEAKKTKLTLRDLGQLWAYCKLVDPDEAFLLTSDGLGSLNKLLNSFRREDLLDLELRLYLHFCPSGIQVTRNRVYRKEYEYRINDVDVIWELFDLGYRIGLN